MEISRRHLFRRAASAAAIAAAPRSIVDLVAQAAVKDGSAASDPIRLHRNENPYGPSPRALAAAQSPGVAAAARYPDAATDALRRRLADFHGVKPEEIVLGCGSREVMRMAVDAYAGPGKRFVTAVPSFPAPAAAARGNGSAIVAVPLTHDYAHDLDAMLAAARDGATLVYICNPNNPTGTLTRRENLEAFVRALPPATYVVIDEAYHHYVRESSGYASFIDRRLSNPRVIVVRTFSKAYGLAGLRVGYAVTASETARALAARAIGDGVNAVAAEAATAALDDPEYLRAGIRRNADDRQEFYNQANARMIKGIDSHANFVMVNSGMRATHAVEQLKALGVLVAEPFPGFDSYIRVSLGSEADMRAFWRAWDRIAPTMTM